MWPGYKLLDLARNQARNQASAGGLSGNFMVLGPCEKPLEIGRGITIGQPGRFSKVTSIWPCSSQRRADEPGGRPGHDPGFWSSREL